MVSVDHSSLSIKSYTARAASYDDSFHAAHAPDLIRQAHIPLGSHVLDLACGTGLATFEAARAVGHGGTVTGIDVTPAMLSQAKSKLAAGEDINGAEVSFHEADITTLGQADVEEKLGLWDEGYDLISCLSCLPLLKDPGAAIRSWAGLLAPGGRLLVDFPTDASNVPSRVFEDLSVDLSKEELLPYKRHWFHGSETLEGLMKDAGLEIAESYMAKGYGSEKTYGTSDEELEQYWEDWSRGAMFEALNLQGDGEAKKRFFDWMKAEGSNGKIEEEEGFHVVIGKKL